MKTLSLEQRLFLGTSVSRYQAALAADIGAQAYLALRGIDQSAANMFRLGVVSDPMTGHEAFRGRLALPYLTPSGPVALRFRCIQNHVCKETVWFTDSKGKPVYCPKYTGPEGDEGHLFNVAALKADSEFLVICEGEIDAIAWTMAGVPAVALSGVKAWKDHFKLTLDDFRIIYVAADRDDAGRGLKSLLIKEVGARPIRYPKGQDANDLWRSGGAEALRALIPG
ncbi:toprim domain-containing protein [Streptomyces sp. MP131-18]|uniref:toprim domain-containing protein n=1 Tax=Streptomyces sp. MP131-18 TaxID=1857892 RepID=UPI0009C80FE4|nr:toprim domain-containing protein [Streptomyces sp. MP131-18]ONK10355.1 DNA primase [Streptomyces sp. MP131-18]